MVRGLELIYQVGVVEPVVGVVVVDEPLMPLMAADIVGLARVRHAKVVGSHPIGVSELVMNGAFGSSITLVCE